MNETAEVKLHFLDIWRILKMRMGLILLTFFLVMVSAAVYVMFLPREFLSKVTMEIKPDNNKGIDPLNMAGAGRADPQFISTQFQIIKKTQVLHPVIEQLDLVKRLSPPGSRMPLQWVTKTLENSMVVNDQRNTTLIEVGVYNTDKDLASEIANTISIVYRNLRQDEVRKNVSTALQEMREELDNKQAEVRELYKEAAKIRNEEGISDPDPEQGSILATQIDRKLGDIEGRAIEKRAAVEKLRNELTSMEQLQPEALMEILRTLKIDNQTVTTIVPELQRNLAKEAELVGAGLGENHPSIKSLRMQQKQYRTTLSEELESIKRAKKTELILEEAQLKSLDERQVEVKKQYSEDKTRTSKYAEAKAKYISSRMLMSSLQLRYDAARFDQTITTQPVIIREKAEPALRADKPKILTYMVIAALLGIVLGVGLAFFIEYLDTSVKNIEDIERYLSLTVLAVIPKDIAVLYKQKRDTADAEAYRILKANIEFNLTDRDANTFTLVSGGPGEGKSTTLNNLAFSYAKGGANVLVVDADLRRPSQHRFFDVSHDVGLTDYIKGKATLDEIIKPTKLDNLSFIPSGQMPQEDAGILNSARMTELMAILKKRYDIVFFDSPPILGVSDASLLVSEVDNTIMVVQHRRFPRGMLLRVKQAVAHVGGNLIGVVLNNVDTKTDDAYSYYSSYNDYYAPRRERAPVKNAAAAVKSNDGQDY